MMKNLKFWGKVCLPEMGITLGISFLMMLFAGWRGWSWMGSGQAARAEMLLSLFPWYFIIVGALMVFMSIIGCFMVYIPALLSVNCTRRSAFLGMMVTHLAMIGIVTAVSAVIWNVTESDIAVSGRALLLPAFGGLMAVAAAAGIMGCVIVRWGKIGIMMIVAGLFGGGLGAGFWAAGFDGFAVWFQDMAHMAERNRPLAYGVSLGTGAGLLFLMAVLAAMVIRKMEARL